MKIQLKFWVILVIFTVGLGTALALDPKSSMFFHKSITGPENAGGGGFVHQQTVPNENGFAWVYRKTIDGHPATVVAFMEQNCLVRVNLIASAGFPYGLVARVVTFSVGSLAAAQGQRPSQAELQQRGRIIWNTIDSNLQHGGIRNFNTGCYDIRGQTIRLPQEITITLTIK